LNKDKQMKRKDILYIAPYLIPIMAIIGLRLGGIYAWMTPFVLFVVLPIIEQLIKPNADNYTQDEDAKRSSILFFDILLFLNVPIVWLCVILYAIVFSQTNFQTAETIGLILTLGMVLGSNGINVAHELGHRINPFAKFAAFLLLLPSNYAHFTLEHNYGHHKNVATPRDPASAKKHENIFSFWITTIRGSYINSWKIQSMLLKQKGYPFFSLQNQMVWFSLASILFNIGVFMFFGLKVWLFLTGAAFISVLLLETINYIEHYGLRRKHINGSVYEAVSVQHSWNSDHVIGRIFLYELTRHSDHHAKSTKKYQVLNHADKSPQLPYGYPASMILALIPPIWFSMIHPVLDQYQSSTSSDTN
jgi:alkane 1-monooxygenase